MEYIRSFMALYRFKYKATVKFNLKIPVLEISFVLKFRKYDLPLENILLTTITAIKS